MRIGNITFDCAEPERVCAFWAALLGYEREEPPPGLIEQLREAGWSEEELGSRRAAQDPGGTGPRLFFQRVPESKTAKNRLHLDVASAPGRQADRAEVDAARDRALDLGATLVRTHDAALGPLVEYHHVMADPEGNEFCVQ